MSLTFPDAGTASLTMVVARNVRSLMAQRGVSQTQLAHAMGLSQTAVSKRLRGVTPFDTRDLQTISESFQVSPSALLEQTAWLPREDLNLQPAGNRKHAGQGRHGVLVTLRRPSIDHSVDEVTHQFSPVYRDDLPAAP